jgi:hypothetical protein
MSVYGVVDVSRRPLVSGPQHPEPASRCRKKIWCRSVESNRIADHHSSAAFPRSRGAPQIRARRRASSFQNRRRLFDQASTWKPLHSTAPFLHSAKALSCALNSSSLLLRPMLSSAGGQALPRSPFARLVLVVSFTENAFAFNENEYGRIRK